MRQQTAIDDRRLARIATAQHGIATIEQLRSCGVTSDVVKRRVSAGRLHRIHRGVYAVGHRALGGEGRWMAAVLACGEGAVLSHVSAAGLWGIVSRVIAPVHVTVPTTAGRSQRPGIRLHRSPYLPKEVTTQHRRIAVTTPARTISDLRIMLTASELRQSIREAEARNLDLGPDHRSDRTNSELEYLFLRLCSRHRLPQPEVNVRLDRFIVDFLWRAEWLVVETDGWRYHRGSVARVHDVARDARLKQLGFEVLRFGWAEVAGDPSGVAAAVRDALEGEWRVLGGMRQ